MVSSLSMGSEKQRSVWSTTQISLTAYLSGPIGGCYLLSQNLKALGKESLAKKVMWIGAITTVLLLSALLVIPADLIERIPRILIPLLYTSAITSYAQTYLKKPIKELIAGGRKKSSFFKTIFAILCLLAVQIPLVFLFGYIMILNP